MPSESKKQKAKKQKKIRIPSDSDPDPYQNVTDPEHRWPVTLLMAKYGI
jgi:hypothetical protein